MAHQQMTFYLLECIQYNTYKNKQGGSSEELGELCLYIQKYRQMQA